MSTNRLRSVLADKWLLILLVAALVLRIFAYPLLHSNGYTSDEREYIHIATKLAEGSEFRDSNGDLSIRAPLYPYVLSILISLFANGVFAAHLLGCLLGTVIVFLSFRLALQIGLTRKAAFIVAAVTTVYPGLVIFSGLILTETVYIVFVLSTMLFLYRCIEKPRIQDAILIGVFSGLASLTRAVFVGFFPIALLLVIVVRLKIEKKTIGLLAVAGFVWCLVLAPWAMRNYEIHGTVMPVSSGGGNSLLTGNNPFATGTWRTESGFENWHEERAKSFGVNDISRLNEVERSALSGNIAREYIVSHPLRVVELAFKKAYIFWIFPITNSDSNIPLQAVATGSDFVLFLGAGVGILAMWKIRRRLIPIIGVLVFFSMIQIVLHAEARFRLPLIPFLALFFGAGIEMMLEQKKQRALFSTAGQRWFVGGLLTLLISIYAITGWLFLTGVL